MRGAVARASARQLHDNDGGLKPALLGMALLFSALPAHADGTAADALATCRDGSLSQADRLAALLKIGWSERPYSQVGDDVYIATMFLGNIDGTKPETWAETMAWARNLQTAAETQRSESVSAEAPPRALRNGTGDVLLVEAGARASGCIFAAESPRDFEVFATSPTARLVQQGPRLWYWEETAGLRVVVSALDPQATAMMEQAPLYHLTATISTTRFASASAP